MKDSTRNRMAATGAIISVVALLSFGVATTALADDGTGAPPDTSVTSPPADDSTPTADPTQSAEPTPTDSPDATPATDDSTPVVTNFARTNNNNNNDDPKKVFVCKYVGKPGVNETLKGGKNPISVSVHAIQHNEWDGTVPGYFSDAQDRSYVLAYDTGQDTPDISACPAPVGPPCANSGSLTWTRDAHLSTATVTLKSGFSSCDVSLNSYQTEGATWATSGNQTFVDHDTVHLTTANPTATLTVTVQGCFQQQDLYIGTTKFDGVDGALPHYPTSVVPTGLIDHWNGAVDCTPPPVIKPDVTISHGECYYNADQGYSFEPIFLTYDNTASNQPVDFVVSAPYGDLSRLAVPGGTSVTVQAQDGWQNGVGYEVTAGDQVFEVSVPAFDCAPPPVVTPPSATIDFGDCTADGLSKDVTVTLTAGTNDTTFQILVNGKQVGEKSVVVAGHQLVLPVMTLKGGDTIEVKSGEVTLTSVVTVDTSDCVVPTPTPTPTPTTTTTGGADTGLNGGEPGVQGTNWGMVTGLGLAGLMLAIVALTLTFRPKRSQRTDEATADTL